MIQIEKMTKLYQMGDTIVRALDGVDLHVSRGEFVSITGASGSGKSTIMHLLGCLDRPSGGAYILNGKRVDQLSDRKLYEIRNSTIVFAFQTFNLVNRTSAVDNVAVPLLYARKRHSRKLATAALQRVGMAHRASHKPS